MSVSEMRCTADQGRSPKAYDNKDLLEPFHLRECVEVSKNPAQGRR